MITYSEEALEFIGKLSSGGMRDAITLLDKCLSYSEELTVENVIKALGQSYYDIFLDFQEAIYDGDYAKAVTIIEKEYNSGKDLKLFISNYLKFLIDEVKLWCKVSKEYINIPFSEDIISRVTDDRYRDNTFLSDMLKDIKDLDAEIRYNPNPKYIILAAIWEMLN